MWDDEDNNPYGSFGRRDSEASETGGVPYGFGRPETPSSTSGSPTQGSPRFAEHQSLSDVDYEDDAQAQPQRSRSYTSRIEQWLDTNPDQDILIMDAGKNVEGGGSYITYTIRTGDLVVRRRYSDFASLRQALVNLHPTLIIPPIPEKHTMADYAAKPTKAKEDVGIIELRKRMLAVFLNRCRRMKQVREDDVWWRFLDPNASWNEVLKSHPVASIPKNVLKAPPLNTANPSPGHNYLPVPAQSAKLKSTAGNSASGTPTSPPNNSAMPSAAAHTTPGPSYFGRFPPDSKDLTEEELDPYFVNFEASSRDLEALLQGSMEKVNRRLLSHLHAWSEDMAELGGRLNAFSLSEHTQNLAVPIEKVGQAVDSTYISTGELASNLSSNFAEPMRESAQFAGVVRSVLRYRILKRVQEEMTKDELEKKRNLLESLERSELEARRIQQYLDSAGPPPSTPKRSMSTGSQRTARTTPRQEQEDTASIDSDFPPTHGDGGSPPTAQQGGPASEPSSPSNNHRKSASGSFLGKGVFGRINHALHGFVDADPERSRRDQIGKTRENLSQLEQALEVSKQDVKDASKGVMEDLKRFQSEKEEDLKRYMVAFARCHIDWAKQSQNHWEEARAEVERIDPR